MIIWGFGVFYFTLSAGIFFCRRQRTDQPYKLRAGYRFFTIFFIPLGGRGTIDFVIEKFMDTSSGTELL
jgi:hypothetical protein